MKPTLITSLLAVFTLSINTLFAQCPAPATPISTANLVVDLPFTNGSGSDASGNNLSATLSTAVTTTGKFADVNAAVLFGGTASGGTIGNNALLTATDQLTITCWFNSGNIALSQRIADKLSGTTAGNFMLDIFQQKFRFFAGSVTVNPTYVLSSNTWYFVACTYDGTNAKVYLNSILIATTPLTGNLTANTSPLNIGKDQSGNNCFLGKMDDFKYYTRALDATEISGLYEEPVFAVQPNDAQICSLQGTAGLSSGAASKYGAVSYKWKKDGNYISDGPVYSGATSQFLNISNATAGEAGQYVAEAYSPNCFLTTSDTADVTFITPVLPNTAGLVVHFPFNNGSLNDVSGNGLNASNSGGIISAADQNGTNNGAVYFTGVDHSFVPHNSLMDVTNQLTISCWFKTNTNSGTQCIVNKIPGITTNNFYVDLYNQQIRFFCGSASVSSPANISYNTWYHLACTYDGANVKIYINGNIVASTVYTGTLTPNTASLAIGTNQAANGNKFWGNINDLRIYSRALSPSEILFDKSLAEIVSQPVDRTLCLGETARFTTTASSSSNLAYQWKKNGLSLVDGGNISGATNDTLTITNISAADFSSYSCELYNSLCTLYSTDTASLAGASAYYVSNDHLVMYFPMSNGSGSDLSGNGLDMTTMLGYGVVSDKDNHSGQAMFLNGSNSQFNVAAPDYTIMYPSNYSVSFSVWVRPTGNSSQRIIDKENSYIIDIYQNKFRFILDGTEIVSSATNVAVNVWQHVACTYDGSVMNIYINGVLDASYATTNANLLQNNYQFLFGVAISGSFRYQGDLDEFRMYTRTLTDNEIKGLYSGAGLTAQPVSTNACGSGAVMLTTNALAGSSIVYQWYHNGAVLANDTLNSYTIPSYSGADSGSYFCQVTSGCGAFDSDTAFVDQQIVNTATTQSGFTLSATNAANTTFQWLDCGNGYTVIPGAAGISYTPSASGSYAVEVSTNGCTDTSACTTVNLVGMQEYRALHVSIHPNPASSVIYIETGSTGKSEIALYSMEGKLIQTITLTAGQNMLNISELSPGFYSLRIDTDGVSSFVKFVKQ
jgi:hypothetical protein